jgi:hypothetical protein
MRSKSGDLGLHLVRHFSFWMRFSFSMKTYPTMPISSPVLSDVILNRSVKTNCELEIVVINQNGVKFSVRVVFYVYKIWAKIEYFAYKMQVLLQFFRFYHTLRTGHGNQN